MHTSISEDSCHIAGWNEKQDYTLMCGSDAARLRFSSKTQDATEAFLSLFIDFFYCVDFGEIYAIKVNTPELRLIDRISRVSRQ